MKTSSKIVEIIKGDNDREISSNFLDDYTFIDIDIIVSVSIDDKNYEGTVQTGHIYNHNDYSLPSNSVSLYEGHSVIEALDSAYENDFIDPDFIEIINEDCETSFTDDEWYALYLEYNHLLAQCQDCVNECISE